MAFLYQYQLSVNGIESKIIFYRAKPAVFLIVIGHGDSNLSWWFDKGKINILVDKVSRRGVDLASNRILSNFK